MFTAGQLAGIAGLLGEMAGAWAFSSVRKLLGVVVVKKCQYVNHCLPMGWE